MVINNLYNSNCILASGKRYNFCGRLFLNILIYYWISKVVGSGRVVGEVTGEAESVCESAETSGASLVYIAI